MIVSITKRSFNFIDKYDNYFGFSTKSNVDYGDGTSFGVYIKEYNQPDNEYKVLFGHELPCDDLVDIYNDWYYSYEDAMNDYQDMYDSDFNDYQEVRFCECNEFNDYEFKKSDCSRECKTYKEYFKDVKDRLFAKDFEDFYISKIDTNSVDYFEISDGEKTYSIKVYTIEHCIYYNDFSFDIRKSKYIS